LEKAVHVTNTTQVSEASVTSWRFESITVGDGPVFEFAASPKTVYMQLAKLSKDLAEVFLVFN
jgi:hypothetical protein